MLQPGSVIGILGGGQLGRMLAQAASRLGFDVHIFTPEKDAPASRVATHATVAAYDDLEAVKQFASACDVVTYEFENVPVATAEAAASVSTLRPGTRALEVAQDRLVEKKFINNETAQTVPFAPVSTADELLSGVETIGTPSILKTRRLGYDGKGQVRINSADDADDAFIQIKGAPAILEGFARFTRELSVIAARSVNGEVKVFPLAENQHEGGILRHSFAPAPVDDITEAEALKIATALLEALDYVGVLAVELFQLEDGSLLVNEIAPRVHNSGHWTQDGCHCDQFEQHIRAVAGWPLGDPSAHSQIEMINLIGDDAKDWQRWLKEPGAVLHLYGKREIRDGRKMGHVNVVKASA